MILGLFFYMLDNIYFHQIDKNIYNKLDVDLVRYKEITTDFLIENNLTIEIVDDNLNIVYSKGVNKHVSKKYSPQEFAELLNDGSIEDINSFEVNVRYITTTDQSGNENTVILKQNISSKELKKIKQIITQYIVVLVLGTVLIVLGSFILCVDNIYKNIKKSFVFIQNSIAKMPYDRTKINILETTLLETRKVAESYNEMLAEMERIKAEKEAIANKNNRLISNLSHDLKSPITTLKGYSEILLEDDISESERKEYAMHINNGATDLNEMISILFEQVKFQNTDYKLNLEKSDINILLRDICANYYMIFDKKGFNVNIDIEEISHIMKFDKINIKRVFTNILENCLSHNVVPTDVCISSETLSDKYVIYFKDNGIGIEENEKNKIFEAFYQGDSSRTSGHSGLGLYVVQQIIEKHGGQIILKSEQDYKTVFEIIFLSEIE